MRVLNKNLLGLVLDVPLKYNQVFREQAIQKLLQSGDKSIACIVEKLNQRVYVKTLVKTVSSANNDRT
ncbi:MAG: hypothetical protein Q8N35_05685 [Methylococcaceae bacterium]|nr:hypothetical protein [Methylococcaceae bacterium]MDZ4156330.1 hypothetical protein [Methylococcales bacterium]MDP2394591.1 hypothetical protein [Methylococcaceae bacterium]MDP3019059.1 hypothetical protein [Methylococcaceae bacterium]MDP3390275.1 hypothetical protein [Methylococcaceae bacterium]